MTRKSIFLLLFIITSTPVYAQESIKNIANGTTFILNKRIEVPANAEYIILGKNRMQKMFSDLSITANNLDTFNTFESTPTLTFNTFLEKTEREAFKAYHECLRRNRKVYSIENNTSPNTNIINTGDNNTNIVINNTNIPNTEYFTTNQPEKCIKPEFTISALLLDKNNHNGGIFTKGLRLKVTGVKVKQRNNYYLTTIFTDHRIAKAICIASTSAPDDISTDQLLAPTTKKSKGLLSTLAKSLGSSNKIAKDYFHIEYPEVSILN